MTRPAAQLYTLRHLDAAVPELIQHAANAGFEGVEFAGGVENGDEDAVVAALEETDVEAVAAHVDIETLESDAESTVEFYRSLGTERLVVPWLGPERFEDATAVEESAERLNALAATVEDLGASLSYHNHDHEFVEVGGRYAFDRFAEATPESLGLELDVGWAAVAGADPAAVLDRWGGRISLVHVSDADEERSPMEVGEGVLDLESVAAAVGNHDVEWAIYEHDDPDDPLASLAHGAEALGRF